jgi:large subunit ribosomal protein L23
VNDERLLTLLRAPRISEKATRIADAHKQFVFEVVKAATKPDVKQAVESIFKVQVASVQMCNVKGKTRSFRRKPGRRPNIKKAYVRLKPGFDIDFIGLK